MNSKYQTLRGFLNRCAVSLTIVLVPLAARGGTSAERGPHLVRDIDPEPSLYGEYISVAFTGSNGERAIFWSLHFSNHCCHESVFWISDGTSEGTFSSADLVGPGVALSLSLTVVVAQEQLFFGASDLENGRELWVSDGTPQGTHLVKDILIGPGGALDGYDWEMIALGDRVFFVANDGVHGHELWVSDGTDSGTNLVADLVPGDVGAAPHALMAVGNKVAFFADNRFWISDGTSAGTGPVPGIPMLSAGGPTDSIGNMAYFRADDGVHGPELWTSDGTALGTHLLKDICPGTCSVWPGELVAVGERLYFSVSDGAHGNGPWVSDGTEAGTRLLKDLGSLASGYFSVDDLVYFFVGYAPEQQLWVTDGTTEGTAPVDVDEFSQLKRGSEFSQLHLVGAVNKKLLFLVDYGAFGLEILAKDRSTGAVEVLRTESSASLDGVYVTCSNSPQLTEVVDGWIGFSTWRGTFVSDGKDTLDPTSTLRDSLGLPEAPRLYGSFGSDGGWYAVIGDGELWVSDHTGVAAHSVMSFDSINELRAIGDRLYFVALHRELWATDGTTEGTRLLLKSLDEIHLREGSQTATRLFMSVDGELWTSDGTPEGTLRFLELTGQRPELGLVVGGDPVTIGELAFFQARDDLHGLELWITDWTPEGTRLVKDIVTGPDSSNPLGLTAVGDKLFFMALDSELWISDGTSGGTRPVKPGPNRPHLWWVGSLPFSAIAGRLYFMSFVEGVGEGVGVWEIWVSDGTAEGTHPVAESESFYITMRSAVESRQGYGYWWLSEQQQGIAAAIGDVLYFLGTGPWSKALWQITEPGAEPAIVRKWNSDFFVVVGCGAEVYLSAMLMSGSTLFLTGVTSSGNELWALPHADRYDARILPEFESMEEAPGVFRFDVNGSMGAEGEPLVSYHWDFSDGESAEGVVVHHQFAPGRHRAELTVSGSGDRIATARQLFTVSCPTGDTSPWIGIDVGLTPLGFRGASDFTAGDATGRLDVCAGGRRIGETRDGFHFTYRPVTGDFLLSARIDALSGGPGTSLGLMVREDLSTSSRHTSVLMELRPTGEESLLRVLTRADDSGATSEVASMPLGGQSALRLARHGDTIQAFASDDGIRWGPPLAAISLAGLPQSAFCGISACAKEPLPEEAFKALDAKVSGLHLDSPKILIPFHRGDSNSSGDVDISDGIAIFGFLFLGNPPALSCKESADVNNDSTIDISDGIYLLEWLFTGGPEPAAPGPAGVPCGVDPDPAGSPGDLGCEAYEACH
ncbi:MAG: hypothetical protein HY717_12890 [Planctomycetes bacterium]|nr:hypothetical protein [Planctomycetota bacterium]